MTNTANTALTLAAAGLALVGVAHSVPGELLLFRRLRTQGRQTVGRAEAGTAQQVLHTPHLRILWGTWHLASVLCWALSALLWRLGTAPWDAALGAWAANGGHCHPGQWHAGFLCHAWQTPGVVRVAGDCDAGVVALKQAIAGGWMGDADAGRLGRRDKNHTATVCLRSRQHNFTKLRNGPTPA